MQLILIRHGLPIAVANQDGTPADPPLSETGVTQAQHMANWLAEEPIDCIYSSPMARARQTAEPLLAHKGQSLRVEPGVAEFDRNETSYTPIEQLKELDHPRWLEFMRTGWYSDTDPAEFQKTVVQALEGIIEDNPGGRVAVVCHGGVINVWTAHLLKLDRMLFFTPNYTSINRFMASKAGARSVHSLNEAGHLRGL